MTTVVIKETAKLSGCINAPPSKSYTHRAVIAASLSNGDSEIKNPIFCDDTIATINACKALGASINIRKDELIIEGPSELTAPKRYIDCKESASTLRFMMPVAGLAKGLTVLTGSLSLKKRPIGALTDSLRQLGIPCEDHNGFPPVSVHGGKIKGGEVSLLGDISSQFVTGLLFACPLAESDTKITLKTPLESKPYVRLTLKILKNHGVNINASSDFGDFTVKSGQNYTPFHHIVPGDYSSAAFIMAAAAITNSNLKLTNLTADQPDIDIVRILREMGAEIEVKKNSAEIFSSELHGIVIDAKDIPDLVPVCAVLACFAKGRTEIINAKRLRIKESDRLASVSSELSKMGGKITELEDGLIVEGPCQMKGTTINPHRDHRIAMACSVAALRAEGKTIITQAECVNKSYPNFFKDLKKLGANIIGG